MNRKAITRSAETIAPARGARVAIAVVGVQVAMAIGIGVAFPAPPADAMPACQHEDGNTNGLPCAWTDPDTGTAYYVSSENYR